LQVTGGSTNATIHLIAMARAAGVNLTLQDFRRLSVRSFSPFFQFLTLNSKGWRVWEGP
jgi:hypothetical protein